jgi:predicted DNA-binding transcriptional regulator AlpA
MSAIICSDIFRIDARPRVDAANPLQNLSARPLRRDLDIDKARFFVCHQVDMETQTESAKVIQQTESFLLDGFGEPPECARWLGISPRTLARLEVQRVGPPRIKVGKKVLYRREAVLQWLASKETAPLRKRGRS